MDNVVPKLIKPATDILKLAKSSDLESAKKSSEGSESIIILHQQQKNEHQKLPAESVINLSQQSVSYQSDALMQEKNKNDKEEELFDQESKSRDEIGSRVDSVLVQISSFNDSFNKALSEFNAKRKFILNENFKSINFDSNTKQILDEVIQNRDIKKVAALTAGKILDIEHFLEQVSNNLAKTIDVADALYKKQLDLLGKVKIDAENVRDSIGSVKILKVVQQQNSLNNIDNVLETIIKDSSSRSARSNVNKRFGVFQEFIERLKNFDSIVKAGSYDNLDSKLKNSELKHARTYMREEITENNIYNKLKEDGKKRIESFLRTNYKYLLAS